MPDQIRPSKRSDRLHPTPTGRVVAGVVYLSRQVKARMDDSPITREQIHAVINELHDLLWDDLKDGIEYKIGAVGRFRVTERGPTIQILPDGERISVPALPQITGVLTPRFKEAWLQANGVRYQDEDGDDIRSA